MHASSPVGLAILVVVGAAAGFVNTLAGAGSLLSLRALMFLGLGPEVANATNRVPVLAQSLAAAHGFSGQGGLDRGLLWRAALPATLGAAAGALGASWVPAAPMRWLLIVALLGVALLGLVAPAPEPGAKEPHRLARPVTWLWLFVAGAYGGFLQAGVGLALLHALSTVGRLDLVRANALKVAVVAIFTVVALGVFVARGQVEWVPALALAVGGVLGARVAVRYATVDKRRLQRLVVGIDVVACVVLAVQELWG